MVLELGTRHQDITLLTDGRRRYGNILFEICGILHLSQKVVYTFVISRFRREIGNWKLEIRKKHINSDVLSNFQFRISSFSIRFSDSTSDFQPENIPHFREKCKLMDEGCRIVKRFFENAFILWPDKTPEKQGYSKTNPSKKTLT